LAICCADPFGIAAVCRLLGKIGLRVIVCGFPLDLAVEPGVLITGNNVVQIPVSGDSGGPAVSVPILIQVEIVVSRGYEGLFDSAPCGLVSVSASPNEIGFGMPRAW
jgi:hypothetical protein